MKQTKPQPVTSAEKFTYAIELLLSQKYREGLSEGIKRGKAAKKVNHGRK